MASYKTSWVQRLIDGAWQKTFAFAHAKTVYTDFANKKTLDKSLEELQKRISDNSYGKVAGGKNLYNCGNEVGGINSDGGENTETNRVRSKGYIKVNSSTTYTASVKNKNIYLGIYLYDKEKKIISVFSWQKGDYTFKTTDITEYVRVTYRTDDDISVSDILEYQIEEGTTATEYEPYFPSNKMLNEIDQRHSTNLTNQQNNGYLQKNLVDYKSLFADLTDNAEGTTHTYSDGILKISRTANIYSGVYIYSGQITPLRGKELVVSFDAKSSVSTMNLRVYIAEDGAAGTTENLTTDYKRYRLNVKAGSTQNNLVIYGNDVAGDVWIKNFMITEKYVEDMTYIDYIKSNMELDTYKADKSETTINLFKPTLLGTTTVNGITVTNNGNGTFSVTGTATGRAEIKLGSITLNPGIYKNLGATAYIQTLDGIVKKVIHDEEFTITEEAPVVIPVVWYDTGETTTNSSRKPMITTNLNATYSDFVPYTGDAGSLNGDVADLRDDVDGIEKEVSTQKINIHYGTGDGNDIVPVKGTDYIKTPPILVNNSANTFEDAQEGPSGGGSIKTIDYTYAKEGNVKFTILDPLIDANTNVSGLVVTPASSALRNGHYYRIKGTATEDATIPLYSVKNPSSDTLFFVAGLSGVMSESTFYYLISDTAGNTKQFETEGHKNTVFSGHSGEVKVSLVVKSGTKVSSTANVRAGYSNVYSVMDRSDKKYSDTADSVLDAIIEMKSK